MRRTVKSNIIIQSTDHLEEEEQDEIVLKVEQTLNLIGVIPIMHNKRMVQVGLRFHFKG